MNDALRNLLRDLAAAPARAKAAVVAALLALVALVSVSGVLSTRPHFVTLYAGLDDVERVAVEKALAEGGVRFRVSNFPGPYNVYVDQGQFDQAQIRVALAEALKRAPTGINAGESGASTIFLSSGERQQSMLKREWQETEHLLQQLDFVERATVTTSMPDPSPLRRREPVTVSVALKLRGSADLAPEQAENIARLVRFRFGVPAENVVISDQSGRTLHDPARRAEPQLDGQLRFEQVASWDRVLAAKANQALELALGRRKAHVTVTSEWDYDQHTTVQETIDGEGVPVQSTKSDTRSPQGSGPGGAAGTASNVATAGFGSENAGYPGAPGGAPAPARADATSSEEQVTYQLPRSRKQTVHSTPRLQRLSVSLVLDEGLAAKRPEIEALVKASVGFDPARNDVLGVSVTRFAEEPAAPEGAQDAEAPAEDPGPGPGLRYWIERGVEIAAALVFAVLLATSLRGSRRPAAAQRTASAGASGTGGAAALGVRGDAGEPDPEALARAAIEELVRTDPRRVGEILSRWASDEALARSGR